MNIFDLLKGKKVLVKTDVGIDVELEIKNVTESHHAQDLEPPTSGNDWRPTSREWTTYDVIFTNGRYRQYKRISDIQIVS